MTRKTFRYAPTEIHDSLSNLRQCLFEERSALRRLRRRRARSRRRNSSQNRNNNEKQTPNDSWGDNIHGVGGDAALHAMSSLIRHMTQQFKHLEEPFLVDGDIDSLNEVAAREKRRKSGSAGYVEEGWTEGDDDHRNFYEPSYRNCGLRERYLWLTKKSAFRNLMQSITQLETRRVSMQMTTFSL
jgi:hypothetical protein